MSIKRGDVVSHCGASQWGVGKVNEICPTWVAIHFNDGIVRKIASSHLGDLHPADPRAFLPVAAVEQKPAQRTTLPKEKKAPRKRAVKAA
ncbi:DUF3553 domain-containing protein [Geomonas azotofigens]|uniref:DUF3553 domain-containing protein n=1 Tax=Geomonas azotofigens TaxID=2843196 RepID=UPI001C10BA1D|nr:DUF3553 domain-containing protein [Geomonas azotofigens]MBU5612826.1 DUF3553 domain-containing protein [Geomonas azotofigens]